MLVGIDGLKLQQQNASLQERLSKLEAYVATPMKTASEPASRTTASGNGGVQQLLTWHAVAELNRSSSAVLISPRQGTEL